MNDDAGGVSAHERPVSPLGAEVLHCYAQAFWHTEAYLSGGCGALLALRAAIDNALQHGSGQCDVFASDGEGYTVQVVAMADADAERQVVPYTDDCARQPWSGAFGPWDVLRANAPMSRARDTTAKARWYCLSRDDAAKLCVDEEDANDVAAESWVLYPHNGPYRVARMIDEAEADARVAAERERCARLIEPPKHCEPWEIRCGAEGIELMRDLAALIRRA